MIESIGAWCGSAAIRNPEYWIGVAVEAGLDALHIMINDHSRARKPRAFRDAKDEKKYPRAGIVALAKLAAEHGIAVHLTTWIMPYKAYILEASQYLIDLAHDCGAESIMFDAEEPWLYAKNAETHKAAAQYLADCFSLVPCPIGVSGIAYTSTAKFGPLAEVCDYVVPQAYATRTTFEKWNVTPEKVAKYLQRYDDRFTLDGGVPVFAGLACYRQSFAGRSAKENIELSAKTAVDWGADTLIYWSLSAMKSKTVARAIAGLRS